MEFLLYLTQDSKAILSILQQAQYRLAENASICRNKDLFGYADTGKRITICTKNIKGSGHDVAFYVNETLTHEAVHAAQQCRNSAFWISKSVMPLPLAKLNDVSRSAKTAGGNSQIEHEAYWMEDKPNDVKYVLKKYCL